MEKNYLYRTCIKQVFEIRYKRCWLDFKIFSWIICTYFLCEWVFLLDLYQMTIFDNHSTLSTHWLFLLCLLPTLEFSSAPLVTIPFVMTPTYLCTYKLAINPIARLILFLSPTNPPQSNFKPSNHLFLLFPFPCTTNATLTLVANVGNSSTILQFLVCLFMCVFSYLILLILCKT